MCQKIAKHTFAHKSKANPVPWYRARPLFKFFFSVCFCKFSQHKHIHINNSQHTMFTMCIYFSTLTKKTLVYVWWGIKKSPDPKCSTTPGPLALVLMFLNRPTYMNLSSWYANEFLHSHFPLGAVDDGFAAWWHLQKLKNLLAILQIMNKINNTADGIFHVLKSHTFLKARSVGW